MEMFVVKDSHGLYHYVCECSDWKPQYGEDCKRCQFYHPKLIRRVKQ